MRSDGKYVFIHPTAEVSDGVTVGEGTKIWHQAQVREGSAIGKRCILAKGVYVDFGVTIGDNCKLQNGVFVYHPAVIGDGVFLGPGVIITNDRHPRAVNPDMKLKQPGDWRPSPVQICSGASVGAGSVLLPGVRIGEWALIGAGSVVTSDVPDHGLVYGNPARVTGYACYCATRLKRVKDDQYSCPGCGRILIIKKVGIDPVP